MGSYLSAGVRWVETERPRARGRRREDRSASNLVIIHSTASGMGEALIEIKSCQLYLFNQLNYSRRSPWMTTLNGNPAISINPSQFTNNFIQIQLIP